MINGKIEGEFCNKTNRYFNEVFVKAIAVNYSGKELWTETILIEKIGPKQCTKFFKIADLLPRPYKLEFNYFIGQNSEFIDTNNRNKEIYFDEINIDGRNVEATFCNRISNTIEDSIINIFGIGDNKEVLWKKNIIIKNLSPADCMNITRHIFTVIFEHPSHYLFNMIKTSMNNNIKFGEINDEISYKDISIKSKRFKGKICNNSLESHSDSFIRFFATSNKNTIIWDEVITIDHIEPGQCKPFIEYTRNDRKPTKWTFTVSGW